jgi:heme/copper-type cytochrome/quinol oxidase subunit 3
MSMKLLYIVTGLLTVLFVAVRLIELKKLAASI